MENDAFTPNVRRAAKNTGYFAFAFGWVGGISQILVWLLIFRELGYSKETFIVYLLGLAFCAVWVLEGNRLRKDDLSSVTKDLSDIVLLAGTLLILDALSGTHSIMMLFLLAMFVNASASFMAVFRHLPKERRKEAIPRPAVMVLALLMIWASISYGSG